MFCPNCGKNCGDVKFCSECGTRLPQKATQTAPMPRTDNYSSNIPIGKHTGISSSLTLYDSCLIIENRPLFKKHSTEIRYDQMVSVLYSRPFKNKFDSFGHIVFRSKANETLPIAGREEFRGDDRTTVTISDDQEFLFYHIFYALKAIAPASAVFSIEDSIAGEISEHMIGDSTLGELFEKYAPFRKPAVDELSKRVEIKTKTAKRIIDYAFDERQKVIYEADPKAAIRDLNYILAKVEEKREQERQEAIQQIIKDREAYVERERMAAAIARRMKE